MRKQVYVSADYDPTSGDQAVVNELNKWGNDNFHAVNFVDMSRVSTGSVADGDDCRICDLKAEFNRQINASSVLLVLFNPIRDSDMSFRHTSIQIAPKTGNGHKAKVTASLLLCNFTHQGAVRLVECNLSDLACVEINQARCMAGNVVAYATTIWFWGADARTSHQR